MKRRAGFTLVELMVTLAVVSIVFAVASLSLAPLLDARDSGEQADRERAAARRTAIESAETVALAPDSASGGAPLLFLPDGRAVGPGVDPLTGVWQTP